MNDKLDGLQGTGPARPTLVYLRVSAEGQMQRAVAYLRVSAKGFQRALALIEQQNALQRFADDGGYKLVGWYMEGDGIELNGTALSRLMADAVSEGRDFNAVLVWNHSRLSRNAAEFTELRWTLRENGIDLVLATESARLGALERQLDQLTDALDEESAS